MKKLMMTLSTVALLALPGCCCKRSSVPKAKTHKAATKKVTKKVVTKKKTAKKVAPKKHAHIELDKNTEELFA